MGLIAAISLLVGGIGIMNIMLATVTERTREIGIRRALGATRSHIVTQFLVETISLSVVGGLTGILVGLLCPFVITRARSLLFNLAPHLAEDLPEVVHRLEPQIVLASLPLAFFISVLVGVLFGIYPAYRAAQMDPIEALRHE
jgi:putative ABC transport system permease protein